MEDEYQVLPGSRRYHQGRAAYFRELASTVTTGSVKAHLLREAEQHEQLARGKPALIVKDKTETRPRRARSGLVLQSGFVEGSSFPVTSPGSLLVAATPVRPGARGLVVRRPGPDQNTATQ